MSETMLKQFDEILGSIYQVVNDNSEDIKSLNYNVHEYEDNFTVEFLLEVDKNKVKDSNINYSEVNEKLTKDRLKEIVEEIKNKPKAEVIFDNKGITIINKDENINGGSTRW